MKSRKYVPLVISASVCILYLTVFFTSFTVLTFPDDFDEERVEERFLIGQNVAYTGDFYFTNHSSTPFPHSRVNVIAMEQPGLNNTPVILSKTVESSEEVVNIRSFHKERPQSGRNIENAVTQPKPLQPAARVQLSSRQGVRTTKGPLTHGELFLFPREPIPVPAPTTVKDRHIKTGNRDILQLSLIRSGTEENVHRDVSSNTAMLFEKTILGEVAGKTEEPRHPMLVRPSSFLAQNTNNIDKHFLSWEKDRNNDNVRRLTTRKSTTGTMEQHPEHFHDNKHKGSHNTYEKQTVNASSLDKWATEPSFRKAYSNPTFTQPGMSSMRSDIHMLKSGSSISKNSSRNATAREEHSVRTIMLSNLIPRNMDSEHTTFARQESMNVRPTMEDAKQSSFEEYKKYQYVRPSVNPRSFYKQPNIRFLRQPEIPTTPTGPRVNPRSFDKQPNIPFLKQHEIPTTPTRPSVNPRSLDKQPNIPFLKQPEIPTTKTGPSVNPRSLEKQPNIPLLKQPEIPTTPIRPSVNPRSFDKQPNIPFLKQPEIPTTPTKPNINPRSLEKQPNIPFLRQPEIPTTPTKPNINPRSLDKQPNIPFLKQPEIPTTKTGPSVNPRSLEKQPNIPLLKQPEIPTTPIRPSVNPRSFDKQPNIPFLKQPEIPTTPTKPNINPRSLEKQPNIPFLRQPEIPTTPTKPNINPRSLDKQPNIPFLRQPEIPTTQTGPSVNPRSLEKQPNIPLLKQPEIPTTPIRPSVNPRSFDKQPNIPFLKQPEIPTTPTKPKINPRSFDKQPNIQFLRQPEIPTTPIRPSVNPRSFDKQPNIPFLKQPEIPTTLTRPSVNPRSLEKQPNIPFLRQPEIPTTPTKPNINPRSLDKQPNIQFLKQPEIPTTKTGPSVNPRSLEKQPNIPLLKQPEIPTTPIRPSVNPRSLDKQPNIPFLKQPEIPTTPTKPNINPRSLEKQPNIPFLRQPEIPTTPTKPNINPRSLDKQPNIPFLRQPEIPTTQTGPSVNPRSLEKQPNIPLLKQPEIPTTPIRPSVNPRSFDKQPNIPFLKQPEIPTTPTKPNINPRSFDKQPNIQFLRQPEIPTTPIRPSVNPRSFDKQPNIPFLRQPEVPATPLHPTVKQKGLNQISYTPNSRLPTTPTAQSSRREQPVIYNTQNNSQNVEQPGIAASVPVSSIGDRTRNISEASNTSFLWKMSLRKMATNAGVESVEDTSTPMPRLRQPTFAPSYNKEVTQQELLYLDMEIDYNRESSILRNGIFRVRKGESQEPSSSREFIQSKKIPISVPSILQSRTTRPKTPDENIINNDNEDEMASNVVPLPVDTTMSAAYPISNLTANSTDAKLYVRVHNNTNSDHTEKEEDGDNFDLDILEVKADLGAVTGSPSEGGIVSPSMGETQNVQIEAFEKPASSGEYHQLLPWLHYTPYGPGEYGAPATVDYDTLSDRSRLQYEEGYKQNYFNQFVSDMVSVRRRLLDARPTSFQINGGTIDDQVKSLCDEEISFISCRTKFYPGKLPEVSVIIAFHNEAWSTLIRSIHSVLDRSPPELLREIILVDDLSDKSHLKTPLEKYLATLVKVKLIRTKTRQGVARARLLGCSIARAPVLIFMDSHTECFPGWLEPLLEGISHDPTTVTFPVISPIDPHDFNSRTSLPTYRGGFRWEGLRFMWDVIPAQQQNGRSETDPIRSPTVPGGVFAINKEFFEKLGAFDPGMMFWGGENLELSFKVWMCNGSIQLLPCSQVGHVFRNSNPVTWSNGQEVANVNSARVAEVWMDDYKNFVYDASFLKSDNYGDISSRQALRQRLRCHDFQWYMRNVYPEKHVPLRLVASGELRPTGTDQCVTSLDGQSGRLYLRRCHGMVEKQLFQVTMQGDFQQNITFVCTSDMTSLHLDGTCADRHNWEYRKDGTIYHRLLQLCLQANSDGSIEITICDSSSWQQWDMTRT